MMTGHSRAGAADAVAAGAGATVADGRGHRLARGSGAALGLALARARKGTVAGTVGGRRRTGGDVYCSTLLMSLISIAVMRESIS